MDTPLKRLRAQRGLTLQEVAAAVNSDTGNISRIENGKQQSADLAEKLVEFFGKGAISELEILYPDRYPAKRRRQVGARVAETARG